MRHCYLWYTTLFLHLLLYGTGATLGVTSASPAIRSDEMSLQCQENELRVDPKIYYGCIVETILGYTEIYKEWNQCLYFCVITNSLYVRPSGMILVKLSRYCSAWRLGPVRQLFVIRPVEVGLNGLQSRRQDPEAIRNDRGEFTYSAKRTVCHQCLHFVDSFKLQGAVTYTELMGVSCLN